MTHDPRVERSRSALESLRPRSVMLHLLCVHRPLAVGLLAAVLLTTTARAQGVLTETYAFANLNVRSTSSCPNGVLAGLQSGTLQFFADGSFTLSGNGTDGCVGTTPTTSSSTNGGTYDLSVDGQVVLDLDPLNPGTELALLQLSWDRELLVFDRGDEFDTESVEGSAEFVVGVRLGAGLTDAVLNGQYLIGEIEYDASGTNVESTVRWGDQVFDGSGGWVGSLESATSFGGGATTPPGPIGPGTYAVAPNGTLSLSGSVVAGAVAPSGDFGFAVATSGSTYTLRLLMKRSPVAPATDALVGDWALSTIGGELDGGPGGPVRAFAGRGDVLIDARSNRMLAAIADGWADSIGGGAEIDANGRELLVRSTGAVSFDPGGTTSRAWLGSGEDLLLFADLATDYFELGLALRRWGALSTDRGRISSADGGVQRLRVRAGAAAAGDVYLIVGSLSGFSPGTAGVPVNLDAYTLATVDAPNTPPLLQSFGVLDAEGRAEGLLSIPGGNPSFIGTTFTHACIAIDPITTLTTLISNPVQLTIEN